MGIPILRLAIVTRQNASINASQAHASTHKPLLSKYSCTFSIKSAFFPAVDCPL